MQHPRKCLREEKKKSAVLVYFTMFVLAFCHSDTTLARLHQPQSPKLNFIPAAISYFICNTKWCSVQTPAHHLSLSQSYLRPLWKCALPHTRPGQTPTSFLTHWHQMEKLFNGPERLLQMLVFTCAEENVESECRSVLKANRRHLPNEAPRLVSEAVTLSSVPPCLRKGRLTPHQQVTSSGWAGG